MKYKILLLIFSITILPIAVSAGKTKTQVPATVTKSPALKASPLNTPKSAVPIAKDTTTLTEDQILNTGPMVILTASQENGSTTVEYNDSLTLEWVSENVDSCTNPYVAKEPNYTKPLTTLLSDEVTIEKATTTQTFFINCKQNSGIFVTSSILVFVEKESLPTVILTADEVEKNIDIEYGSSTTLLWESTNTSTSSCLFSSSFATETSFLDKEQIFVMPYGQMSSGNLVESKLFIVSCKNTSGVATSSVLVNVSSLDKTPNIELKDNRKTSRCIDIRNNIRYGSNDNNTGNEVTKLQTFLNEAGLYKNKPTGFDGKGTILAVTFFQKQEKMIQTGFVGPLTRAKIKQVSCKDS